MAKSILIPVVMTCLAASVSYAGEDCDPGLVRQYQDSLHVVASLKPDKGGQMRVQAADGSEFTAGQARWMQGQLKLVEQSCARHDPGMAARSLNAVQEVLKAHQRKS